MSLYLTDEEATAANLSDFTELKAFSMQLTSPVGRSPTALVRAGRSANGEELSGSAGLGAGSFPSGKIEGALPFVLEPGTGIALRSPVAQSMNGQFQYFEEAI